MNLKAIIEVVAQYAKIFYGWNVGNWKLGGVSRYKVIGVWMLIFVIGAGQGAKDRQAKDHDVISAPYNKQSAAESVSYKTQETRNNFTAETPISAARDKYGAESAYLNKSLCDTYQGAFLSAITVQAGAISAVEEAKRRGAPKALQEAIYRKTGLASRSFPVFQQEERGQVRRFLNKTLREIEADIEASSKYVASVEFLNECWRVSIGE